MGRRMLTTQTLASRESASTFVETLSPQELEVLSEAVGGRLLKENPIDPRDLMRAADKNEDGSVDLKEMTRWWRTAGPQIIVASTGSGPPTGLQLRRLAIISAMPCVAFGFLDNSIMLLAGDAIDSAIGLRFGLSALGCAALGNIVADSLGQLSGGTIDALLRPRLPNPRLTPLQSSSSQVKTTHALASTVGIIFGCILGCFPLLFLDSNPKTTSPPSGGGGENGDSSDGSSSSSSSSGSKVAIPPLSD